MILLAVDPGANGGMAVQYSSSEEVYAASYPDTEGDVTTYIREMSTCKSAEGGKVAIVEAQVGVMGPNIKVSSASMFTFGRNYGFMLGLLHGFGWKIHLVRPAAWQKALSLGSKKAHGGTTPWKNHLKAHAQRLYPNQKITLKTADALLILEYARRMRLNAPQMTQEALV